MAIDLSKLKSVQLASKKSEVDVDSLVDNLFAEDSTEQVAQEPIIKATAPAVPTPKEEVQPREDGFWNTYLGDTIEKVGAGLQNFSANTYGLLDKGARKINDLVGDTSGAHTDASGKAQSGFFGNVGKASKQGATDLRAKSDRYSGKKFTELWENDKAAAVGDVFLQASESLPQSLMAAFTGGAGLAAIGATAANEKYDTLDESNPNMAEVPKMLNALLTGTAEAGSEYLGSVPVGKWLKGMYSKVGSEAAQAQLQKGLAGWIGNNAKKLGVFFPPVAEGTEEIASQVAENITDWATGARPDFNPMEGVFESFVYGAGGGAQFSAMSLPAYGMRVADKAKTGYDLRKATKSFDNLFQDENAANVVSGLNSMSTEEQASWLEGVSQFPDYSEEQKKAAADLLQSSLSYNARRSPEEYKADKENRDQLLIDTEMRNFDSYLSPMIAENGMIQQVKIGDEEVYITKGNILLTANEVGKPVFDPNNSSDQLYYTDKDGNIQVTSSKMVTEVLDIQDSQALREQHLQNVMYGLEQRDNQSSQMAQEVTIENGDPVQFLDPSTGKMVEGIAVDTALPDVIQMEDGRVIPREQVMPNLQSKDAVINPPADETKNDPILAQDEVAVEEEQAAPGSPVIDYLKDKDGYADYDNIADPLEYAAALTAEYPGEELDIINQDLEYANQELESAKNVKSAIESRKKMKVAQDKIDRLNSFKAVFDTNNKVVDPLEQVDPLEDDQESIQDIDLSQLSEPERRVHISQNSNDPLELADLYDQVKDEFEVSQMMPWEAALVGRKISKDSFIENSDKNNVTGAIAKSWFADKDHARKAGLDVIAAELSEYGTPVTENDIVEFVLSHPNNNVKKTNQVAIDTNRRFKEIVKALTGENVGGLESTSGKLVLAGLKAGVRSEQEKQSQPFNSYTVPDAVLNFFEETGLSPDDFDSFEALNDAISIELEKGTFVFPLGESDLQTINNIVQHGIKQQGNYQDFASRVEKAGAQRTAQQPIFETAAAGTQLEPIRGATDTATDTEGVESQPEIIPEESQEQEQEQPEELEYTPEEMAEIDAAVSDNRPLMDVIKEAAQSHEITEAEKQVNIDPTEAQKEAGNYKMGHVSINGFDVTIENPKGSTRSGVDADGKPWSIDMANSYGYIKGTKGKDGDHVDVFVGNSPLSDKVFVVDQVNKDGSFDEHKVMIGFNSTEEAQAAYLANYEQGWTGLGNITEMPVDEFRTWVKDGVKSDPVVEVVEEQAKQPALTIMEEAREAAKKLDEAKPEPTKIDVEGVFGALSTKGEAKLSDHAVKDEAKAEPKMLVSDERKAELVARLRAKMNNLNAGIDPEMFAMGIELAVYHIERGARKFADYAKEMINDLGDEIRPRLKQFYNGVKNDPDYSILEPTMDSDEFVRAFDVMGFVPAKETANNGKRAFVDAVKEKLGKDTMNIVSLRKLAAENGLVDVKDTTIQEYVELALIEKAKDIVSENIPSEKKYKKIVDLYNSQPTISMRSSERVEKQQYSTPLPISFLAGEYINTSNPERVLEPSSGNGMMVFNVPTENVIANEIDVVRLDNLREQPFMQVMNQDGTAEFNIDPVDAVVMNPPFGKSEARDYNGYKIAGLDEQMVVNALLSMKPDGKASIIIGGHTKYKENGTLASEKAFFDYLYNHYNVVDVVNIDGSLYSKQGTSFPVRLILINGQRTSKEKTYAPLKKNANADAVVSFNQLYNRVNEKINEKDLLLQEPTNTDNDGVGVETGNVNGRNVGEGDNSISKQSSKGGRKPSTSSKGPNISSGLSDTTGRTSAVADADGRDLPHTPGRERRGDVRSRQGVDPRVRGENVLQFLNRTDEPGGIDVKEDAVKVDINSEKTPYPAKSKSTAIGSVVPTNVAQSLAKVLSQFKDVDAYVQTKLGYPTKDDLYNALAAEQIDSVAMAIYQIEQNKALIIGDMTGVGKGRQAAAIIRYATLQGKKPIFITEKAHLFSDMYRDLRDIGSASLVPFILNSKSANSDPTITDETGEVIYKPLSDAKKASVLKNGSIPEDFDYAMLTYSQMNTDSKKGSVKKEFISNIASDNIIVMDESHNAGGSGNTGEFIKTLLPSTKGVVFLSGTFAKRPDNMPIYALKTSMSEANMSNDELIEAISKGGIPLQEIMSKNLVEAGQMVRRERDFTGVSIDWLTLDESKDEHYKVFDGVIELFNDLITYQREHITPWVEEVNEAIAESQSSADIKNGTKDFGISNTPFASKTFNVVRQLLFSLKAADVARYAIEELKAGRKPVIAVANTMEGFMNELGAIGQVINNYDFSATLKRGLDGLFRYTEMDSSGKPTHKMINIKELPVDAQERYDELVKQIESFSSGITISPIDVIRDAIEKAGYRVGELTGRTTQLNFNADGTAVIEKRTDTDKKKLARDFNSGDLDVLILNQSASTGISLHASSKFNDKKPRVMISAQTQLDVNTEVQMRGRIDRTGQVHRGAYKYICSPIPAEMRLTMMFKAKLKSLDANTTSNQKSKSNEIDIVDFLNKYGDEVCIEYLKDNPDVNEKLLDPMKMSDKSESELERYTTEDGAASKIAGRVALLSVKEQDMFYKEVSEKYTNVLNYLNDNNSNDLEITTLPLRAETKGSVVVVQGLGTEGNPFAQDSVRETVEVDVLKKPMKADEVKKEMERLTDGASQNQYRSKLVDEINEAEKAEIRAEREKAKLDFKEKSDALRAKKQKDGAKKGLSGDILESYIMSAIDEASEKYDESLTLRVKKIGSRYQSLRKIFNMLPVGRTLMIPNSLNIGPLTTYTEGVLMGYKMKKGKYSPSAITASFATLDSRRKVDIPLSKFEFINAVYSETSQNLDLIKTDLSNWDEKIPTKTRRTGYIVTGNVLQAYGVTEGQLVSYSTVDGDIRQGILLPESYKPETQKMRVKIIKSLPEIINGDEVVDSTGEVKIVRENTFGYSISVPVSKAKGGKYFLDPGLRSFVMGEDFRQMGNKMVGAVLYSNIENAVKYLSDKFGLTSEVTLKGGSSSKADKDNVRFREDHNEINSQFNSELEMQIDGVLPKGHIYKLGLPSDALLSAGIPSFPIELKSERLGYKSTSGKHDYDISEVVGLPNAIANPIAIFKYGDEKKAQNIITELEHNGEKFLVGISITPKIKGHVLEINSVRNVFPKNSESIVDWINGGKMLYSNKEKLLSFLDQQRTNHADVAFVFPNESVKQGYPEALLSATNIVNSFENPTLEQGNILSEIETLSTLLNPPVRIVRDVNEISDKDRDIEKRMRKSRGWYDTRTGEVVVVLQNNKSVADAQKTILHEVVGHLGLRKLLGSEFAPTMESIFDSLPKDLQFALKQKYGSKVVGAEEYASTMAETMSDPGIIQRIVSAFKDAMRKIGFNLKMTDGDIMNLLWKSKNKLTDGDTAFEIMGKMSKAESVKKETESFDRVFRDSATLNDTMDEMSDDPVIKAEMHASIKSKSFQWQEGYQDRMLAVKKLQELLEKHTGKKLPDHMNVYIFENTLSSRNTYEIEQYKELYTNKMMENVKAFISKGYSMPEVENYVIAKHGLERNDYFRINALLDEVNALEKNDAYLEWLPDAIRSNSEKLQDRVAKDKAALLEEIGTRKFSEIEGLSMFPIEKIRQRLAKRDFAGITAIEKELEMSAQEYIDITEGRFENETKELWKSINAATKASLKKWFDSGMINKEVYNKINGMYEYYVPLRGFAEDTAADVYEYFTEQVSPFNNPLKKAYGRKSKPETPFAHIVSAAGSSIVGGNKNIMKLHLLRLAQNNPSDYMTVNKAWYVDNGQIDPETNKPIYDAVFPEYSENIDEYRTNVEEFEAEMEELKAQGIAFKGTKKLKPGYKISKVETSEHMVRAMLNGEEHFILVHGDPRVAQAVNGLNDTGRQESKFMKTVAWGNRQMAANFTTRNPSFIASNLVRDVVFASTALSVKEGSKYTFKFEKNVFGGKAGGALGRFLKGKPNYNNESDVFLKEFLENGGETGYTALYNIDKYKKMIARSVEVGTKASIKDSYMNVVDIFSNGARWAEDLSRFSVYMTSRQSGRTILKSVNDAKEVTVNFNRKGSGSHGAGFARGAYLFFNAAIQSLSNAATLVKKEPVKASAAMLGFASVGYLIPVIVSMLGDDDDLERYNNLPDYVRKNHLCIPMGDGFVKIPLPIELRAFYGLGDQLYRMATGSDHMGESLLNMALSFMDMLPLNPVGGGDTLGNLLPDALVPVYQSYGSNKDFTGKPIARVTPFNEFDPEYLKVYKNANVVPVYVSQLLNSVSGGDDVKKGGYDKAMGIFGTPVNFSNPAAFEHLFESYFGGLWSTTNQLMKTAANGVGIAKDIATGEDNFDWSESQGWRTTPILNRFIDDGKSNGAMSKINDRYFKAVKEMKETKYLIRGYEEKLDSNLSVIEAMKVSSKIAELESGKAGERMYLIEDYTKDIESLNKESQDVPKDRRSEIVETMNDLKSRMLEKLKEIDNRN